MKITLYLDVSSWNANTGDWFAVAKPGTKVPGMKRYRIEVDIPDPREADEIVRATATETDPT